MSIQQLNELSIHVKCVKGKYLNTNINHFEHLNSWNNYKEHPFYEAPFLTNPKPIWADNDSDLVKIDFKERFKNTNFYNFDFDVNNRPLNPIGPTGISGRGVLGKWGPNTAADPLVTRFKRDINNNIILDDNNNKILQFVAIRRKDNNQLALPGGMVDPGESLSITAKREFGEEALNTLEMKNEKKKHTKELLEKFFCQEVCIYEGYVDDPRNTNNAWMVTKCFLWHDYTGNVMNHFKLNAGDDAGEVMWIDYSPGIELDMFASHFDWVQQAYKVITFQKES
jgi:ADP-ribose pyrophosphatase